MKVWLHMAVLAVMAIGVYGQTPQSDPVRRDPAALTLATRASATIGTVLPGSTAEATVALRPNSNNGSNDVVLSQSDNTHHIRLRVSAQGMVRGSVANGDSKDATWAQSPANVLLNLGNYLAAAINSPTAQLEYLGIEQINGVPAEHLRIYLPVLHPQKAFESETRDLWLSQDTFLPVRLSYEMRVHAGSYPFSRVEMDLSNHGSYAGASIPGHALVHLDGTTWGEIHLDNLNLRTAPTSAASEATR